ncbi:MAG: pyruvate, phosphate dikinase [Solirubrobacterales bacterium]|nr:pyruvate, phosphate dikinase [Solirubrobacterales bacterium]
MTSGGGPARWVVPFAEGSAAMRDLLGNKGANLAEMTRVLGAERVPGGFTITTTACVAYMRSGGEAPSGLDEQIDEALGALEAEAGKRFGDPADPLLLSVRSGAPISMPGMLDTVLNLGLGAESTEGLAHRTGNAHLALDSRRRLLQMFGEVVAGVPADSYEEVLSRTRDEAGARYDRELDEGALRKLIDEYLAIYEGHTAEAFPEDPREQLRRSVLAVFDSWNNPRAFTYRRLNGIPDELGTAVTVQRMVFGNTGERSGSGVAFSRDPTTGERRADGDFLVDAQGEDVVAGVRNTEDLGGLADRMPEAHAELLASLERLERHYRDIQDVEYTIEDGRLYILQTRSAKRHALAAVRFASDARHEALLSKEDALRTIDPEALTALLHPAIDPDSDYEVLTRGVPASPGAAKGRIVLTAAAAEAGAAAGEDVILVRPFTSADDVGGFHAARGILTAQGGKSSHAAIVARGMGRPCVCGASEMAVDTAAGVVRIGDRELHAGDTIAIDGSVGTVTGDDVELVRPRVGDAFAEVLGWADDIRRLGVRANADTAEDARHARELGAEGIGLCRTEHMFFGPDREELVREMFISGELARRERAAGAEDGPRESEYRDGLARLAEIQRRDFSALLAEMGGLPVTIRLLDPPLHEFIPVSGFDRELAEAEAAGDEAAVARARERRDVASDLEEVNPMLGTRGARLGLILEGLYEMQARAIAEAAIETGAGGAAGVEIMLPLIAYESELAALRQRVEAVVGEVLGEHASEVPIGTMIELPRACMIAGRIAEHADFFSFGTNDLTQTTLGLSRDDAESGFLPDYASRGLIGRSPFETIDVDGVGELVWIAAERGRATKPELKLGICGEHGGDPASIEFFDEAGLDYVSCSPFRIPVARMAAARAVIG